MEIYKKPDEENFVRDFWFRGGTAYMPSIAQAIEGFLFEKLWKENVDFRFFANGLQVNEMTIYEELF